MLHLRVQGQGGVIRVLPCFLPLLEYLLPSFLQVNRERERSVLRRREALDPRATGWTSKRELRNFLDPREPFPTRLADQGMRGVGPRVDPRATER